MIKNDRQLATAEHQRRRLCDALARSAPVDFDDRLVEAHRQALEADIAKLGAEISAYRGARSGTADLAALNAVDSFGKQLVLARIAAGLTQEELAAKLSKKPQQVQRYEQNLYASASLKTLTQVAHLFVDALQARTKTALGR